MYRNNNHAVINKIAKRSLHTDKMRSFFAVTAIILTTVLFTTLFTISMSLMKSIEYSTMRQVGGSAHGGFKHLTEQQLETLTKSKLIKEYGISRFIAIAQNPQLAKRQIEIKYLDKNEAHYNFVTPLINGVMPEAENDIVLDTITLDMLGLNYALGQKVSLDYTIDNTQYRKDFVLCGVYKGDVMCVASTACVSKTFADDNISGVSGNKSQTGSLQLDVMLGSSINIENHLLKIMADCGYAPNELHYGVNWAYLGNGDSIDFKDMIPIAGLLLLIMLSGYLIIYNIFHISVVKDIQFYGLLKTIGTTPKQIRSLVNIQAALLSAFGIPLGLVLGYFIGLLLLPYIMKILTISYTAVSMHPIIFVGAAIFSLATVFLSCYKPASTASRISPIEAVRYTGLLYNGRKNIKKSVNGSKLHRMAFKNIFRSKRKAMLVISSLSLSIILLYAVYTMVSGFDMDKYLRGTIGTDFTIGDASFYRWSYTDNAPNAVTEKLCEDISQLEGVGNVNKLYSCYMSIPTGDKIETLVKSKLDTIDTIYKPSLEAMLKYKTMSIDLYGIDEGLNSLLNPYVVEGKLDSVLFETGDYTVIERNGWLGDIYHVGEKITLPSGNGQSKDYIVMAIVDDLPLYIYNGSSRVDGLKMYIPSKEYAKHTNNLSIMSALFNVEDGYIKGVEQYIKNSIKQIPTLDYRSRASYEQAFHNMVMTFKTVGYSLSLIVALIGILNFANVIITSILFRRKEFATLQSIGMTSRQLKKMLIVEGLYYAFITLAIVMAIGIPITYLSVSSLSGQLSFFSYHFTMLPILICAPILFAIVVLIPNICAINISKSSIVERLREAEYS